MLAAKDDIISFDLEAGHQIKSCSGAAFNLHPTIDRLIRLEQYERGYEEERFFDREARLNRERYRSICHEQIERDRLQQVERDRLQLLYEGPYTNFYHESNMPMRKYQRF